VAYGFQETLQIVMEEFAIQRKAQKLNIPAVFGPPGIGKSDLGVEAAILDGVVTYRPVNIGDNADPTDVTGTPVPAGLLTLGRPDLATELSGTALKDWEEAMKRQGLSQNASEERVERIIWAVNKVAWEAIVSPVLQLFDDFDKAPDSVQKGLIGLFGTRNYRDYKLHPLSLIMCAGNRVGDDILAGDLSQSILGRVTVITMEAKFEDFRKYAVENPTQIHKDVLMFLEVPGNRDLLFSPIEEGAYRAPSPRGWWEVSQHFFHLPDPNPSKKDELREWNRRRDGIIERKCGVGVMRQWNAWWEILRKVNIDEILKTGVATMPSGEDATMFQYACIFAVARHITKAKIEKGWDGLKPFAESLKGEFRIALLVQIPSKKQAALARHYPEAVDVLMKDLVDEDDNATSGA